MNCDCHHVQHSAGSNAGKTVARRSPYAGRWKPSVDLPDRESNVVGLALEAARSVDRAERPHQANIRSSSPPERVRSTLGVHVRRLAARPCPLSQRLEELGLRLGARREETRRAGLAAAHRGAEEGAGCDRLMIRDRDLCIGPTACPSETQRAAPAKMIGRRARRFVRRTGDLESWASILVGKVAPLRESRR